MFALNISACVDSVLKLGSQALLPLCFSLGSFNHASYSSYSNALSWQQNNSISFGFNLQCAKHFRPQTHVDFLVRRFTLFFGVVLVTTIACFKTGLGSNLLDIVDIFHPSNEKAPNFSLEIRSRDMRLIKYICYFDSTLLLTSHRSCDPKDNF